MFNIFTCEKGHAHHGENFLAYCIFNKLYLGTAFIGALCLLYQIYVQLKVLKSQYFELKVCIFYVAFLSSVNTIIHYSLFTEQLMFQTYFILEIFRFTLFFMVCYYYIQKASGLLPDRR